jgi:2-Cys peroxiredoxin 5
MSSVLIDAAQQATQAAHAGVTSLLAKAQVRPGDTLPPIAVKEADPNESFNLDNISGKNIIIGVPGAFTPPCSSHVPGYIQDYEKFKAKGVQDIYVIAVNDAFVTNAWKAKLAPEGTPVRFIADDKGAFVGALGLLFDATPLLGAPRSKRFVLVTEGNKIVTVAVEDEPPSITVTAANSILAQL